MVDDSTGPRTRELLVFEFGGALFGVDAAKVDTVIGWRPPVPLPRANPELEGVIQDRGRVVTVLRRPVASGEVGASAEHLRLVVCTTSRGHIGLPAEVTRSVGPIELQADPVSGRVVDSAAGAITYIDPETLVSGLLDGRGVA